MMKISNGVKRRKLSPDESPSPDQSSDLFHGAAEWDLEQSYEQKSRAKKARDPTRLPIKTFEGKIEQHHEEKTDSESEPSLDSGSDSDQDESDTPMTEGPDSPERFSGRQQVLQVKEELARLAGMLNEEPEAHAGTFKKLASISASAENPDVKKIALAAQFSVYKDLIPGYRIRAYKDDELGTKVSKDVRQTRQYEQALISGYRSYVEQLAASANPKTKGEDDIESVAVKCACSLLLAVPHFNLRAELLRILVDQLSSRRYNQNFEKCVDTMRSLFQLDDDGGMSLEAVGILTKMMKAKDYKVLEPVVDTFLSLRLLSELSVKGSTTKIDKSEDPMYRGKKRKVQWEPRSKKERKLVRERKKVAKDLKEADAVVSHEDRDRMQSDTLKMVFATYFRILKLGKSELMGAVLEGLARYAHLINQDFFGDLLEALKEITQAASGDDEESSEELDTPRPSMVREALLATQTAFTLLSGQDVAKSASALHLDLSFFTAHTFRSLYSISIDKDIELGARSRLPDPSAGQSETRAKVNVSTPMLLLSRVLSSVLLTPSAPPPSSTVLAFYKRLLTCSLQVPEKSLISILSLLSNITSKHGRKVEPLWHNDERQGDGDFNGESETMAESKPLALGSGVWETELLRYHFSPAVRKEVTELGKALKQTKR